MICKQIYLTCRWDPNRYYHFKSDGAANKDNRRYPTLPSGGVCGVIVIVIGNEHDTS